MKMFFLFTLLTFSAKAFSLYLLVYEGDVPYECKRQAYQEVLAKDDYPVSLINRHLPSDADIERKLKKIHPGLKSYWVPTSLFQLFVLKSFFSDPEFREFTKSLGYSCGFHDKNDPQEKEKFGLYQKEKGVTWDLNIDGQIVNALSQSTKDLFSHYEKLNQRGDFCTFFLRMNDAFLKRLSIPEIPTELEEWQKNHFPFLYSFGKKENVELFLQLFRDHPEIIQKTVAEEERAHREGKFLIYRGAEVVQLHSKNGPIPLLFLPLKAAKQNDEFVMGKEMSSFSLSYANSLFGGCFLSLDACAARYSLPDSKFHAFHALRLDENSLIEDPLFCIPPLHPFVEMFVDGEWFHPHSKIGNKKDPIRYGWYAEENRSFEDQIGFLLRRDLTPEALCKKLLELAAKEAVILHLFPEDLSLPLQNHETAASELKSFE